MDLAEATKKVQAKKPKDNYMIIQGSYGNKLVLPYKDGLAFIAAVGNAEQLEESYQQPCRINPLDTHTFTFRTMSWEEYEDYKIAALLNISVTELKNSRLPVVEEQGNQ